MALFSKLMVSELFNWSVATCCFARQLFIMDSDLFDSQKATESVKNLAVDVYPVKFETMRITHKQDQSKGSYALWIQMVKVYLRSVKNFKDLGITVSYDLSWSDHINEVVKKASRVLGVTNRLLWSKTSVTEFSLLYKSVVRPILEYVVPVWCSFLVKDIVSIENWSPKESVETGSRPKEGRNGKRGMLSPLTRVRTSKFIPPPWYKRWWMEPLPGVFNMLQYFETILSLVESLWSS